MALLAAGIEWDHREVDLKAKPMQLLEVSPKGTVPVLLLPDGQVLPQSIEIMQWALAQNDPHGWRQADQPGKAVLWVETNDTLFKPLLDKYKYAIRHPEQSVQQHREAAMSQFVTPLSQELAEHRWVAGSEPSWADVAIFPFIRQFAGVDLPWFEQHATAALARWLAFWQNHPLFEKAMAKPVPRLALNPDPTPDGSPVQKPQPVDLLK